MDLSGIVEPTVFRPPRARFPIPNRRINAAKAYRARGKAAGTPYRVQKTP